MNVDGLVFVNDALRQLLFEELKQNAAGGFLPAVCTTRYIILLIYVGKTSW